MERSIALFLATAGLIVTAQLPARADCVCRHPQGKTQQGETACIRTPTGPQIAVCEKVLNNSSWRFTGKPCPSAAVAPERNGPRQG
jgi:hypothetical protein